MSTEIQRDTPYPCLPCDRFKLPVRTLTGGTDGVYWGVGWLVVLSPVQSLSLKQDQRPTTSVHHLITPFPISFVRIVQSYCLVRSSSNENEKFHPLTSYTQSSSGSIKDTNISRTRRTTFRVTGHKGGTNLTEDPTITKNLHIPLSPHSRCQRNFYQEDPPVCVPKYT